RIAPLRDLRQRACSIYSALHSSRCLGDSLHLTQVVDLQIAQSLLLDARSHTRAQDHLIERLGKEILRASLDARRDRGQIIGSGDHHDGNVTRRLILLDAAQHLPSIHSRHPNVEQHNVARHSLHDLQRRRAVTGGHDGITLPLQIRSSTARLFGSSSTIKIVPRPSAGALSATLAASRVDIAAGSTGTEVRFVATSCSVALRIFRTSAENSASIVARSCGASSAAIDSMILACGPRNRSYNASTSRCVTSCPPGESDALINSSASRTARSDSSNRSLRAACTGPSASSSSSSQ